MTEKTVSVVMCTYNGEKYIREQLDSILAQTYPLLEVIIQDDGSTDATPDICRAYAARHSNIRFTVNEQNLGFNRNFQSACTKAKGQFVAISDQDDVWFPQKIARLVEAIGNCDACTSPHLRGYTQEQSFVVNPQCSAEGVLFTPIMGHTILFRRDFVQTAVHWSLPVTYDYSLAICASLRNGIAFVPESLSWHRSNDASATAMEARKFTTPNSARPSAWRPYLYGIANYRRLQRKPNWQKVYAYAYEQTSPAHLPEVHKMAGLLLNRSPWALFKLCRLCLKHGNSIYPKKGQTGLRGAIRKFFFPLIFSYGNITYDKR